MAVTPSKTAEVTQEGVLAECIVQPSSGSPQMNSRQNTCQIKVKGPYDVLKDCNNLVMQDLDTAMSNIPLNISQNFDFPAAPGGKWWVTGTSIEQLESGDHAILTLTCELQSQDYDPSSSSGAFDPYQDTWQLRWESYTVKPAGFCSNEPHEDQALTATTSSAKIDGEADRQHIHYFLDAGKDNSGFSNTIQHYWYRTQDGDFVLNDAEQHVLVKMLQDRQALYHYPVLMHHTTKNFMGNISSMIDDDLKYGEDIGADIDHTLSEVPDGCPYTFAKPDGEHDWEWIKTGDDMQHVKMKDKIQFSRTETFMGVLSADQNFYGNRAFDHDNLDTCRWKIGAV